MQISLRGIPGFPVVNYVRIDGAFVRRAIVDAADASKPVQEYVLREEAYLDTIQKAMRSVLTAVENEAGVNNWVADWAETYRPGKTGILTIQNPDGFSGGQRTRVFEAAKQGLASVIEGLKFDEADFEPVESAS